ncbi:DUF982 domain-containing protein [Rhizobium sp. BK376]|uniref:DUF982 domain-containing protein n=1 Tax=Rhizobium sp. BK376 TaxID=2512149 RepID=UPI0010515B71|nr:DUF982 domain-containing protein [Rhizobium sp. BK376]TCR75604.1 uncharacterized protein DUF982 [Rhizobium sp. BK376]
MLTKNLVMTWDEPVYIHVRTRPPQIIHDPKEALAFLANDWAGSREKHQLARELCSAAILGQVSSETARQAFVEAAECAKMSVCAPKSHE